MARHPIIMPQLGESITSGTITKWHKKTGETIEIDEVLFEISTEKVESEIPSIMGGRIEVIHYPEGTTIDVGKVIAEIEDDLSIPFSAGGKVVANQGERDSSPPVQTTAVKSLDSERPTKHYTPLVKSMAQKSGVPLSELDKIQGTGVGGRVNKEDFENYLNNRSHVPSLAVSPSTTATVQVNRSTASSSERITIIPMDNMRKAIAKNMVTSKLTSPHVNSCSEVDLTHLVKFRESFKDHFFKQEGFKLTYTPFIARAIISALKDFPFVNASIDGDNIVVKKDINLGLAVAVPGNGLIVPVIKESDGLSMVGLCRVINQLAEKARNKKLTLDDLQGGTFTYTNVGSFGTIWGTPIILQPQVGIYSSGAIQKRPVVVDEDAIAVRSMMYGVHTYDHRLVDGEMGGRFLEAVHFYLKNMDFKTLF